MSKNKETRDFPLFTSSRPSRNVKKKQAEPEEASPDPMDAMLTEIRSLGTSLGIIDGRLSTIDNRLDNISTSVTSIQEAFSNLSGRVASNESRLTEAEARVSSAEESMLAHERKITSQDKELALLSIAKVDDLENRGRRKNLRVVGLPEKAEGSEPIAQFLTRMLPKWLDLTADLHFEMERAHRSLGSASRANRAPRSVLVRFLRYADKEIILQTARKKRISHEGSQLSFFHDVSAEVLRKRREFDDVRRTLSARDMFRGFAYPAKLRCLHGTQMHLFSSPADVTEFLKALEDT
ncbi:uncharacterized protein LOC113020645 [Tachysurus ichikawai]